MLYIYQNGKNVKLVANSNITITRSKSFTGAFFTITNATLEIIGTEENKITFDGNKENVEATNRVIDVSNGGKLKLENVIIQNNINKGNGGALAILANSEATLKNVKIDSNESIGGTQGGGGIYCNGTLTINDSTISNNNSDNNGGGINGNTSSDITLNNTTITNNTTTQSGGGAIYTRGKLTIEDSIISNNKANNKGGGIYKTDFGAICQISDTTIKGNTAKKGGGIYVSRGKVNIEKNVTITENNATISGGGVNFENEVAGIFTFYDDNVKILAKFDENKNEITETITDEDGNEIEVVKDGDGNPLMETNSNGKKYYYTKEDVYLTHDEGENKYALKIYNNNNDIYDVILFWGQSNMVGYAGCLSDENSPDGRIEEVGGNENFSKKTGIDIEIINKYDKMNHVAIEQEPGTAFDYKYISNSLEEISADTEILGEKLKYEIDENESVNLAYRDVDSTDFSIQQSKGTNMIPQFCSTYYKLTGHKVVVVLTANGGEKIANFLPSDDEEYGEKNKDDDDKQYIYEAMKTKYNAAIKYLEDNNKTIGKKLYVCFQGEADAAGSINRNDPNVEQLMNNAITKYKNTFKKVHNKLKSDLGITNGVIIETGSTPGILNYNEYLKRVAIHNAQEELAQENNDIIIGSDYAWEKLIPNSAGYEIIMGNTNDYENKLAEMRLSVCYHEGAADPNENAIHFTSAALSQIGKETAESIHEYNDAYDGINIYPRMTDKNVVDWTLDEKLNLELMYTKLLGTAPRSSARFTRNDNCQNIFGGLLCNTIK